VFSTGVVRGGNSIDHVITQYHYPGGPAVYAEGSWLLTKGFSMSYTVLCDRATLDFELSRGADALQVTEEGQPPRGIKFDEPDGYAGEIKYMLTAVQNRQAPTVVTAADGLSAIEICEAEAKSVQTGQIVRL
jgi:predicted dehydrogenase